MVAQGKSRRTSRSSNSAISQRNLSATGKRQSFLREAPTPTLNDGTENKVFNFSADDLNIIRHNYNVELAGDSPSTPTNVVDYIQLNMPNIKQRKSSFQPTALPSQKKRGSTNISRNSTTNISAVSVNGQKIFVNIFRAFLVRALFIVHSITTIWASVNVCNDPSIWAFALVSALVAIEGIYTIVFRGGNERKWFSPSIFLYILATALPLQMIERQICDWRKNNNLSKLEDKLYYQLLEQLLLVILIVGRWLFPKGKISREQLSQILLAYLAISSDIVEFFDVFKEIVVYQNTFVQNIVLYAWTLSLLQFPFVLTTSRARKMRLALINEETKLKTRVSFWQVFYDIDMWSIVLANCLQDVPFFVVRLYLITYHSLVTYTMIFFICKNALIIVLQTYRAFVLLNDRYVNPKYEEQQQHSNLQKRRPTGANISALSSSAELKQRKKQKQLNRRLIKKCQNNSVNEMKATVSHPPTQI